MARIVTILVALTCLTGPTSVDAMRKKRTNLTNLADEKAGYALHILHVGKDYAGSGLRNLCNGEMPGFSECIMKSDVYDGGAHGDLPFVVVNCNDEELETIKQNHPEIEFSERDAAIADGPYESNTARLTDPPKVPWGIDRLDSRGISADIDGYFGAGLSPGRGAHIYIADTGIYQHTDFGNRLVPTADSVISDGVFQECGINGLEDKGLRSMECANDRTGHGTHVAGTAAGTSFGVATKATLHAVKVVTGSKYGRASWLLSAMYWIACCGERPAVATLQLETDWPQMESYKRAVAALEAAGVVVVLPAGDRRRGGPADACEDFLKDDGAITVASIGKTVYRYHYHADYFSDTSNYGQCVDVLAPGVDIPTASSLGSGEAITVSGTSVAAAHAAGAAAVAWAKGTYRTAAEVKEAMMEDAMSANRRRREPLIAHRRRRVPGNNEHRSLSGTTDKVVYVPGGIDQIHRRRNPTEHRRRRDIPPGTPPVRSAEDEKEPEDAPTMTLGGKPVYGPSQTEGSWIINFKLPPDGFQFFPASYSETLAIDFCNGIEALPGSAKCLLKGRPRWGGIPFVMMTGTTAELEVLLARPSHNNDPPEVEFVEADVELSFVPEVEEAEEPQAKMGALPQAGRRRRSLSWGLDRIDSLYTLDGAFMVPKSGGHRDYGDGLNISATIYIVDTGVRVTHTDFGGRASAALDVTSGCVIECTAGDTACAQDNNGHGTHVAAVAGGAQYGVAKSAQIRGVKVLGDNGKGMLSWTIAALDWISRKGESPTVALLNFQGIGKSKSFQRATDFANLMGYVTMVVPAGHGGGDACANYPANAKTKRMSGTIGAGTLTVAATTSADLMAEYSNFGPCIDYLAPGSGILTASHTSDTGSMHASGTSLAAAHVAGAAALLLASEQAENPDRVDVFLYLGSYYEGQIDLKAKHAGTKNYLLNVRDAATIPEIEEAATKCYSCQYTKSGCPCMKEWSYPYDGASHKVTDYCANPYGDKNGPYCMTQTKCTIRVEGQPPKRSLTDYCDDVPGRRLSGGWLDAPHVYEPDEYHGPPELAEDNCAAATTTAAPAVQTTNAASSPAVTTTGPATSPPVDGPGSVVTPTDPGAPSSDATPEPQQVLAKIQAETKSLQRDMDCLEKRLKGEPCVS